jgi:predicted TIM-barrel fold metal-dependent hydrolase
MAMLIVDSHAHVYADDDALYPPISNPIRPPKASGSFSSLQVLAKRNGIAQICVVQPGTYYQWDNRFVCDLCKAFPQQTAAICSLDPNDSNSYMQLKQLIREKGVRGLRSYPASDGHLEHPGVRALWRAAEEEGTVVSVLIKNNQVEDLIRMLEKFPHLPIVIDHCLITKPDSELNSVIKNMRRLAKFPNTYAKLSFLPLGSMEDYPFRDMHEPCKRILASYGADRCMWGSNFPCELWTPKSSYAQNLRLFTHEIGLPEAAKDAILGRTAHQLWFRDKSQSRQSSSSGVS